MTASTKSARSNGPILSGILCLVIAATTAMLLAEDRPANTTQTSRKSEKPAPAVTPAGATTSRGTSAGNAPDVARSIVETPNSPDVPNPAATKNRDPSSNSESILLLRTGRMMRGKIARQTTNFIVAGETGDVFVPGTLVEFWGENFDQVKQHMEAVLAPDGTCDQRVEFARWCVTQNLLAEACDQLREALLMAPDRDDIRRALERTEALLGRPVDPDAQTKSSNDSKQTTLDGKTREGLGGLAKHDAKQFIVRIQPILMRNCAISGCHAGENAIGFALHRMNNNTFYRHLAAENVEALKKYIDINEPENSRLLTITQHDHGKAGRVAFDYKQGPAHFETLQQWVESVSDFERHQIASKTARQSSRNGGKANGSGNSPVQTAGYQTGSSRSSVQNAGGTPQYEADPFDPAEFNALVSDRRRRE